MDEKTQHGYLVIADISGFTSYLAKVELEHAHEILTDLLETIVKEFKLLFTISKLEGDAVFAYVSEADTPDGERILELIESTYVAFRRQREASKRNTTCTCKACKSIPTLDLKFFVHHGDFIVQEVSGIHELVGSDVNMIHRLTKNHVPENTGWNAYILFTHRAFQNLGVQLEGIHEQTEHYEHLGEIQIHCIDLHVRYKSIVEARRVLISQEEADHSFSYDFQALPPLIWHWLTNTDKKNLFAAGEAIFTAKARPGGRNGPGASNHCAHGKNLKGSSVETILDWRPFDYFTSESVEGKSIMHQTYKLELISNGTKTRLHILTVMITPSLPRFIRRTMLKMMLSKMLLSHCQTVAKHIAQDMGAEINPIAAQVTA
jgi:class 3 adenylate cyclase